MLDVLITLGQGSLTDEDRASIFFWSGVLVVIGVAMAVGGLIFYRKLRKADEPDPEANEAGFSLSEMRRLYEAGEMSHEEYVQVRDRVLAASKKSMLGDEALAEVKTQVKGEPPVTPPPGLPPTIDTTPEEIDPEEKKDES